MRISGMIGLRFGLRHGIIGEGWLADVDSRGSGKTLLHVDASNYPCVLNGT